MMEQKSVVVTGATSFLGRYVVRELCARGCQVYAIIRPESPSRDVYSTYGNVKTVLANMGETETWTPEIPGGEYFLHFGWDGVGSAGRGSQMIQQKNMEDTEKCLDAAAALGCRVFLFAGSQAEYGPQTGVICEQTPCSPVIEYGKAKREVFSRCFPKAEDAGISWYQARIFSVYGTGDHPWALIPSCVRTFLDGGNIKLSACDQYWNYMYAADAAKVLCELAMSGASPGIYNIASHDTRRLKSFVDDIHHACGGKGSYTLGAYDPKEPTYGIRPDVRKLEDAIGTISQTDFSAGISGIIDHFRIAGEL